MTGRCGGSTQSPSLAYNSSDNEYLVVWQEVGSPSEYEREIFGQRLDANGERLGGAFRISTTGADGDTERASNSPVVAYNSASNEYLVAWHGDGWAVDRRRYEIFGQRIADDGAEIGHDFRISHEGPDGNATRRAVWPALDYNPATDTYLAVWEGDGRPLTARLRSRVSCSIPKEQSWDRTSASLTQAVMAIPLVMGSCRASPRTEAQASSSGLGTVTDSTGTTTSKSSGSGSAHLEARARLGSGVFPRPSGTP